MALLLGRDSQDACLSGKPGNVWEFDRVGTWSPLVIFAEQTRWHVHDRY